MQRNNNCTNNAEKKTEIVSIVQIERVDYIPSGQAAQLAFLLWLLDMPHMADTFPTQNHHYVEYNNHIELRNIEKCETSSKGLKPLNADSTKIVSERILFYKHMFTFNI